MTARAMRALMYCAMISLTIGVSLVVLEVAAMLKLVHWRVVIEDVTGEGRQYTRAWRSDPKLWFRRHPNDHWSSAPQSDIQHSENLPPTLQEPIAFTYDHRGYRNLIDRDEADVVLIGDSYIEGAYVSDRQTAAHQLELALGRPVANLGVAGYGTLQELIVFEDDAVPMSPRIIIWFFFEGNDVWNDGAYEYVMTHKTNELRGPWDKDNTRGWIDRSLTVNSWKRLLRASAPLFNRLPPDYAHVKGAAANTPVIYFVQYASTPWTELLDSNWNVARNSMERAANIAYDAGIDIMFAFIPIKFRVYQPFVRFAADSRAKDWKLWPILERFLEFCRSAGVPCIDLTPLFQDAVRQGGMPYAPEDTHWSAEGHELVATMLAERLRPMFFAR